MATSIPILVPVLYIVLLVGALYTFSTVYRKRNAARISSMDAWFPTHPERDTYITLLQLQPPPSDALLKAALLRRAVTDVQRIIAFREDKAALQQLLQKGSISDDFWTSFLAAEKELEAEIVEVVNEANTFHQGWGSFIFQSASEMVNNVKHRDIFTNVLRLKGEQDVATPPTSSNTKASGPGAKANLLTPTTPQTSAPATPQKKAAALPKMTNLASPSPSASSLPASDLSGSAPGSPSATQKTPGGSNKKNKKRK